MAYIRMLEVIEWCFSLRCWLNLIHSTRFLQYASTFIDWSSVQMSIEYCFYFIIKNQNILLTISTLMLFLRQTINKMDMDINQEFALMQIQLINYAIKIILFCNTWNIVNAYVSHLKRNTFILTKYRGGKINPWSFSIFIF